MPDGRVPHVLIVDDERLIADSLVLILKLQGYSTAAAYTGEQAIEIVPEASRRTFSLPM